MGLILIFIGLVIGLIGGAIGLVVGLVVGAIGLVIGMGVPLLLAAGPLLLILGGIWLLIKLAKDPEKSSKAEVVESGPNEVIEVDESQVVVVSDDDNE